MLFLCELPPCYTYISTGNIFFILLLCSLFSIIIAISTFNTTTTSGLLDLSACLERVSHQWNCLAHSIHCIMCRIILSIALLSLTFGSALGTEWESRCRERTVLPPRPPSLWEMGIWRVARLMYLTQWKPKAEPMKTPFQGGQELAWFMASLLDGVQF